MSKTSKELVKRLLAVALTLVMVIGFMPVAAIPVYATEIGAEETPAPSTEPSEEPSTDDGETSSIPENAIVIKDGVYLTITTNNDLVYDGSSKNLIENAGVYTTSETGEEIPAEGYTVEFTEDSEEPKKYDEFNKFKATDAGTYELFYRVTEGGASVKEDSVKIVISQAESYEGKIDGQELTYTGKAQNLLAKKFDPSDYKNHYSVSYKLDGDKDCTYEELVGTDAGTYNFQVAVQKQIKTNKEWTDDANYKLTVIDVSTVIKPAKLELSVHGEKNKVFDKEYDANTIIFPLIQDTFPGEIVVSVADSANNPIEKSDAKVIAWEITTTQIREGFSSKTVPALKVVVGDFDTYKITIIKQPTEENEKNLEASEPVVITLKEKESPLKDIVKVAIVDKAEKEVKDDIPLGKDIVSYKIKAEITSKNHNKGIFTFSLEDGVSADPIKIASGTTPKIGYSTLIIEESELNKVLFELAQKGKLTGEASFSRRDGSLRIDQKLSISAGPELTVKVNDGDNAKDWYNSEDELEISWPEGYEILGYILHYGDEEDKVLEGNITSLTIDGEKEVENVDVYLFDSNGYVVKSTVAVNRDTTAPEVSIKAEITGTVLDQFLKNISLGIGKSEKNDNGISYKVSFDAKDNGNVQSGVGSVEYQVLTLDKEGYKEATDIYTAWKAYRDYETAYNKYLEDLKTWEDGGKQGDAPIKPEPVVDMPTSKEPDGEPELDDYFTENDIVPVVASNGSYDAYITVEGICMIKYWAIDEAGNRSSEKIAKNFTLENGKPETSDTGYLIIDNTAPEVTVSIVSENAERTPYYPYYYNKEVTITVSVKEENYRYSSKDKLLTLYVNGKEEKTIAADATDLKTEPVKLNENGKYTITVAYTDPSGNEAVDSSGTKISGKEWTVIVDKTAPIPEVVEFPVANRKDTENGHDYYYYGKADVKFDESGENEGIFFKANAGDENFGETISVVGKEWPVDKEGNAIFMLADDDEYKFRLTHTDLAGNVGESDEYGTYIIDRVAPVLNVTFNNAANTVGDTHYYNGDIKATFTVTEKYFDTALMKLDVGDGSREDMNFAADKDDDYTYTKGLTKEGNYKLTVTGEDKAGNKMDEYTSDALVIDKTITAPTISGVEPGHAYKDKDISVSVKGDDTNFDQMTVVITKTYMANENGKTVQRTAEVYNETFYTGNTYSYRVPDGRDADGIYVVTATIRDKATNTATSTPVTFTVNRYGSVYEYVSGITEVNGKYVQKVGEELVIWEYSATELEGNNESLMKNVGIYADGSKIDASDIKVELEHQNGGWYKYIYTIPTVNFDTDAHYKVEISSESVNGVHSSNTKIQNLVAIDFFKDGTAPVLENVTGMEKSIYNEAEHEIKFNIYDSIGLASVKVLVNNEEVFSKEDFEDAMNYEGSVTLDESDSKQHVRFIITDLAGNVTDTDADGFDPDYTFERDLVISTNFWVRLRANTPLLIGCIAGVVVILALGVILIIRKKDKKEEEKTAAAK